MKNYLIIFLIFFSLCSHLSAQTHADSLEYITVQIPINLLSSRFDKQINTYNLNSIFRYHKNFDRISIGLLENFNSTFIRSGEKSIRDDQYFRLSSSYKITDNFRAGILGTSSILSDNRRIEINQASYNNASVFLQLNPYEKLFLSPYFGYSNNRQIGENDYGFIYGAEGVLNQFQISESNFDSYFKFRNEDISPRKNTLRLFNANIINLLSDNITNSFTAQYSDKRKDFYYEADSITSREFNIENNIQSRTETSYFIQDGLRYNNFLDIFFQELSGRVYLRNIDRDTRYRSRQINSSSVFDTEINELRFEFESGTYFSSELFSGALKIFFSERDEKHKTKKFEGAGNIFFEERSRLESSKNNNSTRASISFLGNFDFSPTDKFSFSLYQNKLRYDTPSEFNFDDRDEILSIIRLRYSKMLTPFFEAYLNTEGTYNHTVYVLSQRSSNNNINRILSFAAGGNYRGKNISSSNNFEVSANYTVYDFEDLNQNYRSFSFRQFTATDSTVAKLSSSLAFILYGYLKFSEQGDLKWASFSTRPTRFLEEIYVEPKLAVTYNTILFSLGARIFSLNTYNYKGKEKLNDSRYLSTGPLTEILMIIQNSLYLRLYGWYEFISIKNSASKEIANLNFEMKWNF